jgi:CRISPR-associated protein Csx3
MSGVFASQPTIGNTSYNKLLSVARNPLNVLKASGQRIFVRTERGHELLGLPSAFEMGPNHARWIYRDDRSTIAIRAETSLDEPVFRLVAEVARGGPLELLVTHDIVLGNNEFETPGCVTTDAARGRVELRPARESMVGERYPETTFFIASADRDSIDAIGGDGLLYADGVDRGGSHVVFKTKPVTGFSVAITGSILDASAAEARATAAVGASTAPEAAESSADLYWTELRHGATLAADLGDGRTAEDVRRLDELFRWYPVDAMVHFTTPHGLEQYSGAAWAVRDVTQGPVEFLVATGNPGPVRNILGVVYERQDRATGDWPQWFMFDRYREIQAPDSHADIIHWPIKALCDYAETTGDMSVLDDEVAYTDPVTKAPTQDTETIFEHTVRQIDAIERGCIPDTALVVFGGGDWEDTLQPVDAAMAQHLVSSWTVELAYQTLSRYRAVCERAGREPMARRLADLTERMRADFNRFLVPDGIVAGLAYFGPDGIEYFLHPRDRRTRVSYRLIPMSRGIISGMFTAEQAAKHEQLIARHLTFPDGVRLMDRPMAYTGGTSRIFRRAESAANFGREVGLQYVHAHIRYIEALARIGRPDQAFRALMTICPILLDGDVPSALPRQSNAYFSSSDAAFADRRQAARHFGRLRTGAVAVKGGWRIYSSGPGIYLNQLISNILGLRSCFDDVVIDPVLPGHADGLTFDFEFDGRPVQYRYHVTGDGFGPTEVLVNGASIDGRRAADNQYRVGGMLIDKAAFRAALDRAENIVDITV